MPFSIRQLFPGDVLEFPILPEWEDGTVEELDKAMTEDGYSTAILRDGEVVGAIWLKPDANKDVQVISAWKYRPTKELAVFVREMIAIVSNSMPDRVIYTISKPGKESDRWHQFVGLANKLELNKYQTQYSNNKGV